MYVIRREPCLQFGHNLLCSKKIDLTKPMRQCTYLFFPFEEWVWFWSSIDQGESREDCWLDVAHFTTWWNTTLSHKFNPFGLLMSGKIKCVLRYITLTTFFFHNHGKTGWADFKGVSLATLYPGIIRSAVCGVRLGCRCPWPMTSFRILNCPCLGFFTPPSRNAFTLSPVTPFKTCYHR